LEQLAEQAARALADAEVRVANGRVTGVPDGRLIRWYTTIGLLDRPLPGPGRVARYGPRHLLQLVAVKRLQAQGRPLAEIQLQLAGATDTMLRRIADLPPGLDDPGADDAMFRGPRRLRPPAPFAAPAPSVPVPSMPSVPAPPMPSVPAPSVPAPSVPAPSVPAPSVPARAAPANGMPAEQAPSRFWTARPPIAQPDGASAQGPRVDGQLDTVTKVYGVRLGAVTLLLPVEPGQGDLDDIAAAARPLLDLLAGRGLLNPTEGASS
jgi:hypothetical protein